MMHPILYVLRAYWTETYDDPDEGRVTTGEVSEDISFSSDKDFLQARADNLQRGHTGYWSARRADELRGLHPGFDDFRDTRYRVEDISKQFIGEVYYAHPQSDPERR